MNSTTKIWTTVGLISGVSTLLLIIGFLYAVNDIMNPLGTMTTESQSPLQNTLPAPAIESALDVTAIGDSLAKGTGDDTGKGYVRRSVDLLVKDGTKSKLVNNLGINGLTTAKLLPLLDDQGTQYTLKKAGIIVLSIGGNDLFQGNQQYLKGGALPTEKDLEASVEVAGENFKKIVEKITSINQSAQLVYVSLYNPFSDLEGMKDMGDRAVNQWNNIAMRTMNSYERTLIVPTYDLFKNNGSIYLSSDHFHPNGEGYQAIAERIVQGIAKNEGHKE
ncbi:GDSL-type esterase/lipase family protein [Paenibacillus segetis]|uniref:Lipase/acylhydrolase n=1 Tax=Paenibacillus segetis TaxID=1325360 RepID=A0ABQ1YGH5_9BACL|nr:GDSL-type esterase/lipase family protein [Paenibacillus segetis]GGH23845.1 lipase/acylhydrolase [Paenibacillus segetis]